MSDSDHLVFVMNINHNAKMIVAFVLCVLFTNGSCWFSYKYKFYRWKDDGDSDDNVENNEIVIVVEVEH